MNVYRAKRSSKPGDEKASLVAGELQKLDPQGEGVTARQFHLSQAPAEAPLHADFEWDNEIAGALYRDDQGRLMIRSVYFVQEGASGEQHVTRAFLAVHDTEVEEEEAAEMRLYKPTLAVLEDDEEAGQIIEDAKRQLRSWRDRWRAYADIHQKFQAVFGAINEALDEDEGEEPD